MKCRFTDYLDNRKFIVPLNNIPLVTHLWLIDRNLEASSLHICIRCVNLQYDVMLEEADITRQFPSISKQQFFSRVFWCLNLGFNLIRKISLDEIQNGKKYGQ